MRADRKIRCVLLFLSLVGSMALADDEHLPVRPIPAAAPWMTGAQLLGKLARPSEAHEAEAYIKGIHDATEHKEWCHSDYSGRVTPKQRPADMLARILDGLRAFPPAQLKRNAAELVVEIWQDEWPCPPDGCCP